MVREILPDMKKRIVNLWLAGKKYREINSATGVSNGEISKIINEERDRASDIDRLRELNIALTRGDAPLADAVRGAALIEKLNVLNIPLDKVP